MTQAKILKPVETTYRGTITDPDRWGHYNPRVGDVLVITPAKSGTTWTQSIVAMLLNGGPDLPAPVTELSPWVDANFFPVEDVFPRLEAIKGRRVIKTHTPADGYPVWDGVKTISVYRHPLEVVISLRKHVQNYKDSGDHPILGEPSEALKNYLSREMDTEDCDRDGLASLVRHFEQSAISDRLPDNLNLSYAAMLRDHRGAVAQIDAHIGTGRSDAELDAITKATAFKAMKAKADTFTPEAGSGFWKDEKNFFASGRSGAYGEVFDADDIARYQARFEDLLPNSAHRAFIETGAPL